MGRAYGFTAQLSRFMLLASVAAITLCAFPANAQPNRVTACDILTAHPDDRQRVADPVPIAERDPARAIPACEEAVRSDPNNPRLRYQLGLALDTARRFTDSFASYQQAARAGYVAAGHALGWAYSSGEGVERNDTEAVRWYRWAAERGHTGSMNTLGVMFENGRGVPRDLAQAAQWYRRAYDTDGRVIAGYNLGRLLAGGRGVPQDNARAVQLFRMAVQAGRADAALQLALMAERGEAPQVTPAELIQLLVLAETGAGQRDRALRSINQQVAAGNGAAVEAARRAVIGRADTQQREQEAVRQRREQVFARLSQPAVSGAPAAVPPAVPSASQATVNPPSSQASTNEAIISTSPPSQTAAQADAGSAANTRAHTSSPSQRGVSVHLTAARRIGSNELCHISLSFTNHTSHDVNRMTGRLRVMGRGNRSYAPAQIDQLAHLEFQINFDDRKTANFYIGVTTSNCSNIVEVQPEIIGASHKIFIGGTDIPWHSNCRLFFDITDSQNTSAVPGTVVSRYSPFPYLMQGNQDFDLAQMNRDRRAMSCQTYSVEAGASGNQDFLLMGHDANSCAIFRREQNGAMRLIANEVPAYRWVRTEQPNLATGFVCAGNLVGLNSDGNLLLERRLPRDPATGRSREEIVRAVRVESRVLSTSTGEATSNSNEAPISALRRSVAGKTFLWNNPSMVNIQHALISFDRYANACSYRTRGWNGQLSVPVTGEVEVLASSDPRRAASASSSFRCKPDGADPGGTLGGITLSIVADALHVRQHPGSFVARETDINTPPPTAASIPIPSNVSADLINQARSYLAGKEFIWRDPSRDNYGFNPPDRSLLFDRNASNCYYVHVPFVHLELNPANMSQRERGQTSFTVGRYSNTGEPFVRISCDSSGRSIPENSYFIVVNIGLNVFVGGRSFGYSEPRRN